MNRTVVRFYSTCRAADGRAVCAVLHSRLCPHAPPEMPIKKVDGRWESYSTAESARGAVRDFIRDRGVAWSAGVVELPVCC